MLWSMSFSCRWRIKGPVHYNGLQPRGRKNTLTKTTTTTKRRKEKERKKSGVSKKILIPPTPTSFSLFLYNFFGGGRWGHNKCCLVQNLWCFMNSTWGGHSPVVKIISALQSGLRERGKGEGEWGVRGGGRVLVRGTLRNQSISLIILTVEIIYAYLVAYVCVL